MTGKGLIAIVLIAALSGCAASDSLSRQMADWQSQNVIVALDAWGTPDRREELDGQTLLTWYDRALLPFSFAGDDIAPPVICTRMLAVADDGTITGWRWRGDRCPMVTTGLRGTAMTAVTR